MLKTDRLSGTSLAVAAILAALQCVSIATRVHAQAPAARPMRVVLLGASGNVGSCLLAELVARGHTVTGIARRPEAIAAGPRVRAVQGDVNEPEALAMVLAGHDAVISAVPFSSAPPESFIGAVRLSGVKRYIVVGGAASLMNAQGQRLLDIPPLSQTKSPEPAAGARLLEALKGVTDLDWTFFSPALTFAPGPRTGKFRLGGDVLVTNAEGKSEVSMEDYAVALVDELEKPAHIRQRFTIGY